MSDKKIKEEFNRRGQKSLYKLIKKNRFKPFEITKGMEEAYEYQSKKYGIPNVLDSATRRKIKRIIKSLKRQRLNQDFRVNESDFISSLPDIGSVAPQVANLPTTPPPGPLTSQVRKNPITNLTGTEEALLSPTEKVIAART